jgi:hypothetical protein
MTNPTETEEQKRERLAKETQDLKVEPRKKTDLGLLPHTTYPYAPHPVDHGGS